MILSAPNTRQFTVDLFADFILDKLPKDSNTVIEVIDCVNFYVIKGSTNYKKEDLENEFSISSIRDEFIEKYEDQLYDTKIQNIIQLIEFDTKMEEINSDSFTFFKNSKNCSYHPNQIKEFEDNKSSDFTSLLKNHKEDNFKSIKSQFPFGHSLSQGRLLYYLGKKIYYKISKEQSTPYSNLSVSLVGDKEKQICIDEIITDEKLPINIKLRYNLNQLIDSIKKMDWSLEITNPSVDNSLLTL